MKHLSLPAWFICGLIHIGLVLTFTVKSPAPGPIPVTKFILTQCSAGIRRLESASGQSLKNQLGSITNGVDINHYVAGKLSADTMSSNFLRFSSTGPLLIVDGWGEPLNFAVRASYPDMITPRILWGTNEVAIWSSGPNRSNEFGRGDDVGDVQNLIDSVPNNR